MGNGNGIVTREVAQDIKRLEDVTPPKTCPLGTIVKDSLIRALRLGESAGIIARQNRFLLIVLIIISIKPNGIGVLELALKLLSPL